MSCPCKTCTNERAGPFFMPHASTKILCRECGERNCPRAENHEAECGAPKKINWVWGGGVCGF
jgi:ribosomal protein L37E